MGMAVIHKIKVSLLLLLLPLIAMADTHTLNIGGTTIALSETCDSEHKLNVLHDGTVYCAPATTDTLTDTLHVLHNGTTYSICNGSCGGGGEWPMPATPPDPIELPSTCTWQATPNAYLLSDGNQYFDTGTTVDVMNDISVTTDIINGVNAPIFGTVGASCFMDLTVNPNGIIYLKIGSLTSSTAFPAEYNHPSGKHTYSTRYVSGTSRPKKGLLVDETQVATKTSYSCATNDKLYVFKNDHIPSVNDNLAASGGMKLYNITITNKNGTILHNYQPVAAGTTICGYTALTNAMWDSVTKKLYYPGGSGQMGYGVDP